MQPRFEDILHLVIWNGYAEDVWQAAGTCKETWTDDRIWFPYLVEMGYGPKKKSRFQIIAEKCICTDRGKAKTVAIGRKGIPTVFWSTDTAMKRFLELASMAEKEGFMDSFIEGLERRDVNGKTVFSGTKFNSVWDISERLMNSPNIIYCPNTKGGVPYYHASPYQDKNIWYQLLSWKAAYNWVDSRERLNKPKPTNYYSMMIRLYNEQYLDLFGPKPLRQKASLYRQQFGRR